MQTLSCRSGGGGLATRDCCKRASLVNHSRVTDSHSPSLATSYDDGRGALDLHILGMHPSSATDRRNFWRLFTSLRARTTADPFAWHNPVMQSFESVSTWSQPTPEPASDLRSQLIQDLALRIVDLDNRRVRVAVDGYTASGKTSLANELEVAVRDLGRPTLRASFDDFKKPWRHAMEKGYDRVTGDGYYRNAPDFESARSLLLEPSAPDASGVIALCAHDPFTGADHRGVVVEAPVDAVLIVDSVFAMRPEYNDHWDFRIWIEIAPELSLRRGIARDTEMEGAELAELLHRERYRTAEQIYFTEVDPTSIADVIIDNTNFANPFIVTL